MSKTKSVRRTRRRRTNRRSDSPAPRPVRDPRPLLDRILDTPRLAHILPRLPPDVLHRVIQRCGLEDCGELVALAAPSQLGRVFDLDLWRAGQPGTDEQFDADRFGVWLEVLLECGASLAAPSGAQLRLTFARIAKGWVFAIVPAGVRAGSEVAPCACVRETLLGRKIRCK